MRKMPANSVDFILTDPPYLVNYRDRDGRTIQNDADDAWLKPAMREAYRVLKQDRVAIMFYGWTKIDAFFDAWRSAGFRPVGHIVFRKSYSSKSRFLRYQHEQAFLLAKGRPPLPKQPLGDVMEMPYSGNKLHPTQKPIPSLVPLIRTFTLQGETVFDPFAGSGSTCAAAALTGRKYIGIELDAKYRQAASTRLERVKARIAAKRSSCRSGSSSQLAPLADNFSEIYVVPILGTGVYYRRAYHCPQHIDAVCGESGRTAGTARSQGRARCMVSRGR
jgi:site-specific DNA-methyltransferase (adenine-specific)